MENEEVRDSLKALIEEIMPELGDVDMEAHITEEYGINSVSIIRLIVEAERKYGVEFSDYELALGEYTTFSDMVAVLKNKLDKKDE